MLQALQYTDILEYQIQKKFMAAGNKLWEGGPSHISNLGTYILCLFGCWLIVPVFFAGWKYLETHYTRYAISENRIFVEKGIFNKEIEEVELYRVKDYSIQQPFFLRLFSLFKLTMNTSDSTQPILIFEAIPDGDTVRNIIRKRVETLRGEKNVGEVDFKGGM